VTGKFTEESENFAALQVMSIYKKSYFMCETEEKAHMMFKE